MGPSGVDCILGPIICNKPYAYNDDVVMLFFHILLPIKSKWRKYTLDGITLFYQSESTFDERSIQLILCRVWICVQIKESMLMLQLLNFMRMLSPPLFLSLANLVVIRFCIAFVWSIDFDASINWNAICNAPLVCKRWIYLFGYSINRLQNVICMCNDEFAIMSFSECIFYHCSSCCAECC